MSNVKAYTDKQLLDRMKSMPSFLYLPLTYHVIVVRKTTDPEKYNDKLYLFKGKKFIDVMSCTANSGKYGLLNFFKWNTKGTAIIKFDEVYYNSFMKSDGKTVRHHNGKMQCLRQISPLKYYRDSNKDETLDETGDISIGNNSTNVHANSYTQKKGIVSWSIGRWGTGCTVVNDLTKYYEVLMAKIPFNEPVTYTGLKEW